MTQYLSSVHSVSADASDPVTPEPVSPEQMHQTMAKVFGLQAG